MRKKSKTINIRTTEQDFKNIQRRAKRAGMSVTGYMTTMALEGKTIVIEGLPEATLELRHIGNNVNQLTRLCHEGRITCPELKPFKEEVRGVWQSLNSLTQREV